MLCLEKIMNNLVEALKHYAICITYDSPKPSLIVPIQMRICGATIITRILLKHIDNYKLGISLPTTSITRFLPDHYHDIFAHLLALLAVRNLQIAEELYGELVSCRGLRNLLILMKGKIGARKFTG